ncbi:hypothetical protein FHR83_006787 [Actinoplanes campanulatus]|uniref:Antibiotic biosynthesis monooxygenase n=1 Tax=Actinoplanes campanulatus TaxID=113559 RepID=A0A7W5AMZ3_9ACTN|nr:hypothetical protein [Actinoplanes campanulatus]MBB3099081.1 hypothetical protein [Actinoplanes campanulatus]GGN39126.1 hypothetical protein GCM10010109_66710 [Actinoplanes campanulatus]GID40238.1 hypothetical protein Aca09nite_67440 [Actinoplanes campanulatus]
MTSVPQYVILHRRDRGSEATEQLFSVWPETDRAQAVEHAAELQSDANNLYGRPRDTYRVARLAFLDEEN